MAGSDTSIGGAQRSFPETTWSVIARLRHPDASAGLEELCRRYWKPVYHYVRVAWAKSNEDAKDLSQAFFAWLLEGQGLQGYDAGCGGFRAFLMTLLRRFVGHQEEALARLKRGGGVKTVPLTDDALPDPKSSDPVEAFDREWLNALTRVAVERLRARLVAEGRERFLHVFEAYDLAAASERPTYVELAARLGIKESDVSNHLTAAREALCQEIRAELARITTDARELEEEWTRLFG